MQNDKIKVEVAFASPTEQRIIAIEIPEGCTVLEAIELSGIRQVFPEIDLTVHKVGVFSQLRALDDEVFAGDRVEIYRGLLIDPKEARRAKAKKGV